MKKLAIIWFLVSFNMLGQVDIISNRFKDSEVIRVKILYLDISIGIPLEYGYIGLTANKKYFTLGHTPDTNEPQCSIKGINKGILQLLIDLETEGKDNERRRSGKFGKKTKIKLIINKVETEFIHFGNVDEGIIKFMDNMYEMEAPIPYLD